MEYFEFRIRFANRVKEIRKEKGISHLKMEDGDFGIHRRTIQEVEAGNQDVRVETLFRVAQRLNVDIREFFTFEEY